MKCSMLANKPCKQALQLNKNCQKIDLIKSVAVFYRGKIFIREKRKWIYSSGEMKATKDFIL